MITKLVSVEKIGCSNPSKKESTDGKCFNYNQWERLGGITTTIGIPFVGVGYNGWEKARVYLRDGKGWNCEIRGKKLGIIGYGNIGSQLSVLAEGLGSTSGTLSENTVSNNLPKNSKKAKNKSFEKKSCKMNHQWREFETQYRVM